MRIATGVPSAVHEREANHRSEAKSARARSKAPSTAASSPRTAIAVLSAAGILLHLILRYIAGSESALSLLPLYATLILGGTPLILELAGKLVLRGYTDVKVMDGGLSAWEANGYPVDQKDSK